MLFNLTRLNYILLKYLEIFNILVKDANQAGTSTHQDKSGDRPVCFLRIELPERIAFHIMKMKGGAKDTVVSKPPAVIPLV